MYGLIHVVLKDFVVSAAGLPVWKKILSEAGCEEPEEKKLLDTSVATGDEVTFTLLAAAVKVLNLPVDKVLQGFGRHFIQYTLRSGNSGFLKSQGATFPEFLDNINSIHNHLERTHPSAKFPFLFAEFSARSNSATLTYKSSRQGFKSLVVGLVEEVGLRLYGVDVVLETNQYVAEQELRRSFSELRAASWRVTWTRRENGPEPLPEPAEVAKTPKVPFPVLHGAISELMSALRMRRISASGLASPRSPRSNTADLAKGPVEEIVRPRRVRLSVKSEKLEAVQNRKDDSNLDELLFRTVQAQEVAAEWADSTLPRVSAFWSAPRGRAEDYELSEDDVRADAFVSHSWGAPPDWETVMGPEISHGDVKATMLCVMAKDVAAAGGDSQSWGSVRMWVDRACVVQDRPELKELAVPLVDKFMQRCEHVCVVFTWSYLDRLWCAYELANILVGRDSRQVWMQNELLVTERTLPLYFDSVRSFSVARAKCSLEADRAVLMAKIDQQYVSVEGFTILVKVTAIALMARSMAFRAGRSRVMRDRFFQPWVTLAESLGFQKLASVLSTCCSLDWQQVQGADPAAPDDEGVSATRDHALIHSWFDEKVLPLLREVAKAADKKTAKPRDSSRRPTIPKMRPGVPVRVCL